MVETHDPQPDSPRRGPVAELARISAALSSTLHGPALAETVVRHVAQLLPSDGSFLCEFDDASDALIFRGAHGLPADVVRTMETAPPLPRGRGTFSQLAQSSEPLIVDDLEAAGAMRSPFLPWFVQAGYRSMLGVPLMREGRTMGGLVIFRQARGGFTADEIDLLSAYAAECALAMAHARLFALLDERSRSLATALAEQAASSEVLRVMAVSRADSQPVFDTIARRASQLCEGEMCAVFGFDNGLIHIRAHDNWSAEGLRVFQGMYPRAPQDPSIAALCIATRRVVHVPDTESSPQVPQDSLVLTRGLNFRAVVAVPMLRDGEPIGAIGVMRSAPRAFSDGQIALLQTFADQAVVALETSRLFREVQERNEEIARHRDRMKSELQLAREIQLGMVPVEFPAPSAARPVDVHARLEPAYEVGGDLYDFFWRKDGRLVFVVADVSDKGAPAALYMARARTLVRALAHLGASATPADVLERVNEDLCIGNQHTMFVTMMLGLLDPSSGELQVCNAGHPELLVVDGAGMVRRLAGPRGAPLGILPGSRYDTSMHRLNPAEALLAYTDGITEASDAQDRLFGEDRLEAALRSLGGATAQQIVGGVIDAVHQFVDAAPSADDIAVLALRPFALFGPTAKRGAQRRWIRLEIEPREEALEGVVAAVEDLSTRNGLPLPASHRLQVVLDEALSNIIHHAHGQAGGAASSIRVWLAVGTHGFDAEIEDEGRPFDPTRAPPPLPTGNVAERRPGGVGLHLMQRLCGALSYRREGGMNRLVMSVPFGEPDRQ